MSTEKSTAKTHDSAKGIEVLIGAEVSMVRLGYDVTLIFYGGRGRDGQYAELSLNAPFQLKGGGQTFAVDSDSIGTLPPVLHLIHTTLTNIAYDDDETISVEFSNGYSFTVSPVAGYEAWTLTGDDLAYYVATDT